MRYLTLQEDIVPGPGNIIKRNGVLSKNVFAAVTYCLGY